MGRWKLKVDLRSRFSEDGTMKPGEEWSAAGHKVPELSKKDSLSAQVPELVPELLKKGAQSVHCDAGTSNIKIESQPEVTPILPDVTAAEDDDDDDDPVSQVGDTKLPFSSYVQTNDHSGFPYTATRKGDVSGTIYEVETLGADDTERQQENMKDRNVNSDDSSTTVYEIEILEGDLGRQEKDSAKNSDSFDDSDAEVQESVDLDQNPDYFYSENPQSVTKIPNSGQTKSKSDSNLVEEGAVMKRNVESGGNRGTIIPEPDVPGTESAKIVALKPGNVSLSEDLERYILGENVTSESPHVSEAKGDASCADGNDHADAQARGEQKDADGLVDGVQRSENVDALNSQQMCTQRENVNHPNGPEAESTVDEDRTSTKGHDAAHTQVGKMCDEGNGLVQTSKICTVARKPSKPTCSVCFRLFKSVQRRDEHISRHNEMKYICPSASCSSLYETYQTLQDHFRHSHGSTLKKADKVRCIIKPSSSTVNAANSTIKHKCELCQREFFTKALWDYHKKHHAEMTHKCPQPCGSIFEDFPSLVKHHLWKHGSRLANTDESSHRIKNGKCKEVCNESEEKSQKNLKSVPVKCKGIKWSERLVCKICSRKFASEEGKKIHENSHEKMVFKCSCGSMYQDFKTLQSHNYYIHRLKLLSTQSVQYRIKPTLTFVRNVVTNRWSTKTGSQWEQKKKCHICNRQLRTKLNYDYHLAHHKEMMYKCPQPCGYQYIYFHRLKLHAMDAHKICIPVADKKQYRLKEDEKFTKGNKIETLFRELTCQICKRKFQTKEQKDHHLAQHDTMVYLCPGAGCQNLFIDFCHLQKHSVSMHNKRLLKTQEKKYRIKPDRRMKDQEQFDKNVSSKICEPKNLANKFPCHLCQRLFKSQKDRAIHIKYHTEMIYMCPERCGYRYLEFEQLRHHSWNVHGTGLTMSRSHYRVKSLGSTKPRRGITGDHVMGNENKCHFCHRKFRYFADKDYHVEHHDKMRYRCPCGYMYMEFNDLASHVRCRQNTHDFRVHHEDRSLYAIKQNADHLDESTCQSRMGQGQEDARSSVQPELNLQPFMVHESENITEEDTPPKHVQIEKSAYAPTGNQAEHDTGSAIIKSDGQKNYDNICEYTLSTVQRKDSCDLVGKGTKYKCPVVQPTCGSEFRDFETLRQHCKCDHNIQLNDNEEVGYRSKKPRRPRKDNRPRCGLCQRMFNTEANRNEHMVKHDQMKFRCPAKNCGYLYEDVLNLRSHCRDIHDIKLTKMDENRCLINYQEYDSSMCNETHTSVKSEDEETTTEQIMFVCGLCNRLFKTEKDRDDHVLKHDELRYKCPAWQCRHMYLDVQSLKQHIAYCTDSNHSFCLEEEEEEYCRIDKIKDSQADSIGNLHSYLGTVIQKDGSQIGAVDIHVAVNNVTPVKDMSPVGKYMTDDSMTESMISSDISLNSSRDNAIKLVVDDITRRLVANIIWYEEHIVSPLHTEKVKKRIPLNITQSSDTDEEENADQTNDCATQDAHQPEISGSTDEQLGLPFDLLNTILDTDLSFNSDVLDSLLDAADETKPEVGGSEVESLRIASCYSLSPVINDHDDHQSSIPVRYDVQSEHSYAQPRESALPSEKAPSEGTVNVIEPSTNRELVASRSMDADLLSDTDVVIEDLGFNMEILPTAQSEAEFSQPSLIPNASSRFGASISPYRDVSVDSGVYEHVSLHSPVMGSVGDGNAPSQKSNSKTTDVHNSTGQTVQNSGEAR